MMGISNPQKIQKIRKPIVRGDHERVMMFTFSPLSEKKLVLSRFNNKNKYKYDQNKYCCLMLYNVTHI